ncbi:hypothetical protein DFH08DRAFT_1081574 [Mycena albidolilacea]|uniref:F-box domain-containing protein n=1 Tax=Mycena albidolilacea TaxID=1033008 RepID=A0AAD6ZY85_9AGAR|nr:hypothetical protein DFH08DRAFT_1081574 [Mycena albidolilacea]
MNISDSRLPILWRPQNRTFLASAVEFTWFYVATSPTDFPPELLPRIFLQLSYISSLRAEAVCVQWNAIVAQDPELSVQMFKKRSKLYVKSANLDSPSTECKAITVQLHPGMNELSYIMGEELALADEFLSIPVVIMTKLVVTGPGLSYKIKVINPKGIKPMDVFVAMEKDFVAGIHRFYGSI